MWKRNIAVYMIAECREVEKMLNNDNFEVSEEEINRIWKRFYKIDESRNRENGGNGIGLSLVKAIMNNYGNDFGVENKDKGVEFYFEIDIVNENKL